VDGGQYAMEDYHVFSIENLESQPVDHGQILHVDDIAWAVKQMWAPDAAFKNDTYYFYFPAKDKDDIFRIGVATSSAPEGPFTPQPEPIEGSYSIDPTVFIDDDGQAYMYFGGLWGGQLENWSTGNFDPNGSEPNPGDPALGPKVVKLTPDMLNFEGPVQEIIITDKDGDPLLAGDHERRFFEAAWMHKYDGMYYLSYSTGDTHLISYATSEHPTGPFEFQGYVLKPVLGWTTHHSIVEFQGKWYLFYHDSTLSGGVSHKRNVKVAELIYNEDGSIQTIAP
jgi:beta-xylosidase